MVEVGNCTLLWLFVKFGRDRTQVGDVKSEEYFLRLPLLKNVDSFLLYAGFRQA